MTNIYDKEEINNLLIRIKENVNDKAAADELYIKLGKSVYFIARLYLIKTSLDEKKFNHKDIEDIVGSTFVIVLTKIDQFKTPKNGAAWIFKITENLCKQLKRKRRKEVPINSVNIADKRDFAEDVTNRIILDEIFRDLTEEEKSILILSELFNFTYEEIAKIVKLSVPTVNRRIRSIKDKHKINNE